MKSYRLFLMLIFIPSVLFSQKADITELFLDETPLEIKLSIAIKDIKAIASDTVYTPYMMHYKNGNGWDSIKIEVRARGNYRIQED